MSRLSIISMLDRIYCPCYQAVLVVLLVKSLLPMQEIQETQDRSLGQEYPLGKKWQPTPLFVPGKFYGQRSVEAYSNPLQYSWPGKFHGQRSLAAYSSWGCKESDMSELLSTITQLEVKLLVRRMFLPLCCPSILPNMWEELNPYFEQMSEYCRKGWPNK